jgi:choline kinase
MDAILLAAGLGHRLGLSDGRPKALLEFGGRSLLARHLANLSDLGVARVTVCTGYRAELIEQAIASCRRPSTCCIANPDYHQGSVKSLCMVRTALQAGRDVLLMDADVLYPAHILQRLAASDHRNCLLLDRHYVPGDEPVKVCVRDRQIVEFSKRPDPTLKWDFMGESVGFFKFDATLGARLAAMTEAYVGSGRSDAPHEAVIRDLILSGNHGIGFEDVSGAPWIEIDFPDDIRRATTEILPALEDA